MFLKVIACEIAFREICHCAARSKNLIDLEYLTQGHHDTPKSGVLEIQRRIDAVPAGRYDAILIGYGLCSSILTGLRSTHTPLVIPRGHDCISFFLGSKERYQKMFGERPGTYYYTSGWLECARRRGLGPGTMLSSVGAPSGQSQYEAWVERYGEEKAQALLEAMGEWTAHYTHGVLIDFEFTKHLGLEETVRQICADRGWIYERVEGDLILLQRFLDGEWPAADYLVVKPGERVQPTFDDSIIGAVPPVPVPPAG